ncbi:hypothetical protein [Natrinema pallidum]|nr:hypothetical protein [Natrinema pallidum]
MVLMNLVAAPTNRLGGRLAIETGGSDPQRARLGTRGGQEVRVDE